MHKFLRSGIGMIMLFTMTAFTCNTTTWLNLAQQDLPVFAQEANNILLVVDAADAPLAKEVATGVGSALKLVSDAVVAYKANPTATTLQNVRAAIDKAAPDIQGLMDTVVSKFTNQNNIAVVTIILSSMVATLDLMANQIGVQPNAARGVRMAKASTHGVTFTKIPNKGQLQQFWHDQVCAKTVVCPAIG